MRHFLEKWWLTLFHHKALFKQGISDSFGLKSEDLLRVVDDLRTLDRKNDAARIDFAYAFD
jgi:hypothetical protein